MDKLTTLENTVLTGTPQEIAEICKSLPKGADTERALAIACRFRGLDYVKSLVENGAAFRTEGDVRYYLALIDISSEVKELARLCINMGPMYPTIIISSKVGKEVLDDLYNLFSDSYFKYRFMFCDNKIKKSIRLDKLPVRQRAEIVGYLSENGFDPSELLFYSILNNDKEMTAVLKEMGVTFSEKHITALTEGRRGTLWREFFHILNFADDGECFEVLKNAVGELGDKKLRFSECMLRYEYYPEHNRSFYSDPKKFGFILEHLNQKQMNKKAIMICAINADSAACLEICTKHGWLTRPGDRDELIEYATKLNTTECLAFLLDYKNRNFDLVAEREKAERTARRKLNAAPDSMTALRELFRWKKQEDGTLVITGYIGTNTVIKIPPKIGRSVVTAIGMQAFSIRYSRNIPKDKDKPWFKARRRLSKVVLPNGIKSIGYEAFAWCKKLKNINIPDSVTDIDDRAFIYCEGLTEAIIPASVTVMGKGVFSNCPKLTAIVEPKSYAEEYCKQNNIPFRYKGADSYSFEE